MDMALNENQSMIQQLAKKFAQTELEPITYTKQYLRLFQN